MDVKGRLPYDAGSSAVWTIAVVYAWKLFMNFLDK